MPVKIKGNVNETVLKPFSEVVSLVLMGLIMLNLTIAKRIKVTTFLIKIIDVYVHNHRENSPPN